MHDANGYAAQVQDGRPVSSPLLRFNVATTDSKEMDRTSHILNKSQDNEHLDSKVFAYENIFTMWEMCFLRNVIFY